MLGLNGISNVYSRPNRLAKNKGMKYHVDYAKWILSSHNLNNTRDFIMKSYVNWSFYKGNQWIFDEDLDGFLMDESGDVRNRIKFVKNTIRPIVEFYRGSAIRLDMNYSVQSMTTQAIDRRDTSLVRSKFLTGVAAKFPEFANEIKKTNIVGDSEGETEEMHQALYRDEYEDYTNSIIEKIAEVNDFEELKVRIMTHIALDGMGILKEEERYGSQQWEVQEGRQFIRDATAKRPDLKDSEYMGDWCMMSVADIVEMYPRIRKTTIKELENAAINTNANFLHSYVQIELQATTGKVPVYKLYWRDIEYEEWGMVLDQYDYPVLERINNKDSKYTSRDLISIKNLNEYKDEYEVIKIHFCDNDDNVISNSKVIPVDVTRYCHIVPSEFLTNVNDDLVLDYGLRKYVQKYSYNKRFPDYPYHVYCWGYDNGEILSPIDDLISPQRFTNRVTSMGESQVNNMRGSGTIIDESAIDSQEEVMAAMNQSKPVFIKGGRLGVNNSIGSYNTDTRGPVQIFDIIRYMDGVASSMIGGGEALTGQGGAYRANATVNAQNVSQGTTMQEPVFFALDRIVKSSYLCMSNRGRRIMCSNKRKLSFTVGDKGAVVINVNKDFETEEFRVRMVRSNNPDMEKQAANDMLLALRERQLIDDSIVSKYFNKATLQDIGMAIREHAVNLIEVERQRAKAQESQNAQSQLALKAQMELQNNEADMQREVSLGQANLEAATRQMSRVPMGTSPNSGR